MDRDERGRGRLFAQVLQQTTNKQEMAFGLCVCVVIVFTFLSGASGASVRHSDLETSTSNADDREPEAVAESRENIVLDFVDSVTGEVLVEASPTTSVRLRLLVTKGEDPLQTVSPFRCEASSTDGRYHEQLADDEGCGLEWSMMAGPNPPDHSLAVYSGIVRLPDFLVPSVLQVSCQFQLCSSSSQNQCKGRCEHATLDEKNRLVRDLETSRQQHQHRHHRRFQQQQQLQQQQRQQQQQEIEKQIRTTSIRVLPSVNYVQTARQTEADVAAERGNKRSHLMGHPDPFLYLNPITCSLFLILLIVFLILYVAFLRSLRRSIEEIKREIEAQRSRDKFLVM